MFEQELAQLKKHNLLRSLTDIEPYDGPHVIMNGKKRLLMCSNDYLGLSCRPALRDAATRAMAVYGFGSGASRLVSGTNPLHLQLEQRIAQFKKTEAALLFNSGYAANTGVIPAIAGEGDAIISDTLNHASIVDGCRLSGAAVHIYRHRDIEHAEVILKKAHSARRRLIVTDGVFSMDGDLAPLKELAFLADKYNGLLMADDAHATGVFGAAGTGTAEHFGVAGRVPIQMGTLGKAFGSFGAYIAGARDLIEYLVNKSRSFIYSTALPPAVCAASLAALDIIEREPGLREKLWKNRERYVKGLKAFGIDTGASQSPIVPLMLQDQTNAVEAGKKLAEYGIYAPAMRPPTVPQGTARIRTTVMATHSFEQIDRALEILGIMKHEGYF